MNDPLVSVIMTVYNCERFVADSLDSILFQTFRDFEVVIYNDASTDCSWDIINRLLKKRYNFSSHYKYCLIDNNGENVGCGEARNRAIKLARGKYIAIQDADDWSMKGRLEEEIKILENDKDIFCVSSWANQVNEDGTHHHTMNYPPEKNENIIGKILKFENPVIDPAVVLRKDMFNELDGYLDEWKLIPDFYLWARAAVNGYKFANIQLPLIFYRRHPNSITGRNLRAAIREHNAMCRVFIEPNRNIIKGFLTK